MTRLLPRPLLVGCGTVAVLLALIVAGCGGDGDGAEGPEGAAREAAREYVDALLAGDGERACGLMTEEVSTEFENAPGAEDCASGFELASERLGEEQRRLLEDADVLIEDVEGRTATGTVRVSEQLSTPIEMRLVDGSWRFATRPQTP